MINLISKRACAVLALACLFAVPSYAQLGKLDADFYACQGIGYYATDVLVQPDSSIIVVGAFSYAHERAMSGIAKLKKDGTNDYSFGIGSGANGTIHTVARQADGKLLIGGEFTSYNGTACSRIARLNPDGSLDAGFATGTGFNNAVFRIVVQADGRIMAGGSFTSYKGAGVSAIVRLDTAGTRDTTFSTGTNPTTNTIAIQSDGKYLVGGSYHATYKAMRRLHANGSLDTTFNSGGAGPSSHVYGIRQLSDGRICVLGAFSTYNGGTANRIVMLNGDGSVRTAFSAGTGLNNNARAVLEDAGGGIIVAGHFTAYKGASINRILRIDSTGSRDTTFNPGSGFDHQCFALAYAPGGSLVAAGSFTKYNTYARLGLARLGGTGAIDAAFMRRSGLNDAVRAIGVQSDGKTVLAGDFTRFHDRAVGSIVRLDEKGEIDTTFNPGTGTNARIRSIKVLPDDKILIGGDFTQLNGSARTGFAKLNADGSADGGFSAYTNGIVNRIETDASGRIYLCGSFTAVNGSSRSRLGRLLANGTLDGGIAFGTLNGTAYDLELQPDGKMVVGGLFTTYAGVAANGVARIDSTGTLDTAFSAGGGANGTVYAVALQGDGKVVIGGIFSQYNGSARQFIARVNAAGANDSAFAASANGDVRSIIPYRHGLFAGGSFSQVNGTARRGMAYLDSTGTLDAGYYNEVDLAANDLFTAYDDNINGRLLIGGTFPTLQNAVSPNFGGLTGAFDVAAIDSVKIDTLLCAGGAANVTFKKLSNFNTGNVFQVQMSNSSGSFTSPVVIGSKTASGSGWESVSVTIPSVTALATGYKVRIVSTKAVHVSEASNSFGVDTLAPLIAPSSRNVCSDTAYTFIFDSIVATSDSIEVGYDSTFYMPYAVSGSSSLTITVGVGETDTIWIRSKSAEGCVSTSVSFHCKVSQRPGDVKMPAPMAVLSDTAYNFVLSGIKALYGESNIIWSLDSAFSDPDTSTSPLSLNITVSVDSSAMLWMYSRNSSSGCVSNVKSTILITKSHYIDTSFVYGTDTMLCVGQPAEYFVDSSTTGLKYEIRLNGNVIDTAHGNGSTIQLQSTVNDTSAVYTIWMRNVSNDWIQLDSAFVVDAIEEVDTPEFAVTDTLMYYLDSICYTALANNSLAIRYSIVSGYATVDSITGCILSATGNFVLRATAFGLPGCGSKHADIKVSVTSVKDIEAPEPQLIVVEGYDTVTIVFDSIYADTLGHYIEWAFDESFEDSEILASPATINFDMTTGSYRQVWLRAYNAVTKKHSKAKWTWARLTYPMPNAGLLDKTKWVYDLDGSDEFSYVDDKPYDPANQQAGFSTKWALNYNWGDLPDTYSPAHCGNHNIWNHRCETQIYNYGNYDGTQIDGSGDEVTFSNGVAHLTATRIPDEYKTCGTCFSDDPDEVNSDNCQGLETNPCVNGKLFQYKSGMLCSRKHFSFIERSIYELRCKFPPEAGTWPAFWFFGAGTCTDSGCPAPIEIDVFDRVGWNEPTFEQMYWKFPINIIDYSSTSCTAQIFKETPCNYTEDWHTYTMVTTPVSTSVTPSSKIVFFVDGKEVWSTTLSLPDMLPSYMDFSSPVIINLATWDGYYDTADFEIDYFRHYTAATDNLDEAADYLHNVEGGEAKTLESPWYISMPFFINNNKHLVVPNTSSDFTADISSSSNIALLNTGNDVEAYYKRDMSNVVYRTKMSGSSFEEMPIDACHFQYTQSGFPYPTSIRLNDAKNFLTPWHSNTLDQDLIFFQSTSNTLNYYSASSGSPSGWWEVIGRRKSVPNNNKVPIKNCAGYISVDNLERVWYKGTDNDLYTWGFGGGFGDLGLSKVDLAYSNNASPVVVAKCGCLAFYIDNDKNLRQLYWWNGWYELPTPVVNIYEQVLGTSTHIPLKNELILDEENARVYILGVNGAVYYYNYDYSMPKFNALKKLGYSSQIYTANNASRCEDYYNAESNLVLSSDKNTIYYKSTEGDIWYYFNDREDSRTQQGEQISGANWNKTPIRYREQIRGPIAIEQEENGRLFYVGADKKMFMASWVGAENPIICNGDPSSVKTDVIYVSYKGDSVSTMQESKDKASGEDPLNQISVYPNPSQGTFTFRITAPADAQAQVLVYDVNGKQMYSGVINISTGYGELIWNSNNVTEGVYFYRVEYNNGETAQGKLVRL